MYNYFLYFDVVSQISWALHNLTIRLWPTRLNYLTHISQQKSFFKTYLCRKWMFFMCTYVCTRMRVFSTYVDILNWILHNSNQQCHMPCHTHNATSFFCYRQLEIPFGSTASKKNHCFVEPLPTFLQLEHRFTTDKTSSQVKVSRTTPTKRNKYKTL